MNIDKGSFPYIREYERPKLSDDLLELFIDYYFTARRISPDSDTIGMTLWTVITDREGYSYAVKTSHMGHCEGWDRLIEKRVREHLVDIGVNSQRVWRLMVNLEIKKEGHLIPNHRLHGGSSVGVDGTNRIYVRQHLIKGFY